MADINVSNILLGAGDLYVSRQANLGTVPAEPAFVDPAFDPATLGADGFEGAMDALVDGNTWMYAGATQDGIELAYAPDNADIEVDQLKGAAMIINTGLTVTISTTMAEATLENLLVAWGLADNAMADDGSRFNIGMPGDDPVERRLAVVGKGTPVTTTDVDGNTTISATERAYYARRVISAEGATLNLSRTDPTTYGVTFRLLPDDAANGAEFGVIVDRVIPAA